MTKDIEPTTLHTALEAYAEHLGNEAGYRPVALIKNRQTTVRLLKKHHDDVPLAHIDLSACVSMIDLWRNRPLSERTGMPFAASTVAKTLSELIRFFGWLDMSPQFEWTAPSHFGQISRRVRRLPSDRRAMAEVFTMDHLVVLYRHASPMQRLMLCLAMNCGMGPAEMGRLERSNFILEGNGEFAIDLLPGEGILRFVRPKTGVFGEWLLWPETVEVVKSAIARSKELGSELLFVSNAGHPMWRESANSSSAFHSQWLRLLKGVENHDVPKLPFSTIRKQMAEQIRREDGDELARKFRGHIGNAGLIDHFCVERFRPLHEALRKMRIALASVFEPHTP